MQQNYAGRCIGHNDKKWTACFIDIKQSLSMKTKVNQQNAQINSG